MMMVIQSCPALDDSVGYFWPCFPVFCFLFQLFYALDSVTFDGVNCQPVFGGLYFFVLLTVPSIIAFSSEAVHITWPK